MQKNVIHRVVAVALGVMLLLVAAFPGAAATEQTRYGYSLLQNDTQRLAYRAIAEGIGRLDTEILLEISGVMDQNSTAFQDISYAEQMVVRDYPEYFWYHGGYGLQTDGTSVVFKPSDYMVNGQLVSAGSAQLTDAQAQVEATVQQAMATIPANPSQYDIAHAIHDYVVKAVEYAAVGDHQTAYGALACGKAVCAGYARAYQLLMNRAGISCWYITGQSYAPDGTLVGHAWNLVWLDGKCYYSDATWDDQGDELFHEYLNMSLEEIQKTHFTNDPLPGPCGHDDYTFFVRSDGHGVCDIRGHKEPAEVAECFEIKHQEGKEVEYYCTIHYHGADFRQWLNNNLSLIVEALGLEPGCRYQVVQLGMEHHVTISGTLRQTPSQTEPTEPETQPTEPVTQSTEPETQPTEPVTQPTEPMTQPTEPETRPTEPETVPTEPVTQPTTSETNPTPSETQPAESIPFTEPVEQPSDTPQTQPSVNTEATSGTEGPQPDDDLPSQDATVEQNDHQQTQPSKDGPGQKPVEDPMNHDMMGILIGAAIAAVIVIVTLVTLVHRKNK